MSKASAVLMTVLLIFLLSLSMVGSLRRGGAGTASFISPAYADCVELSIPDITDNYKDFIKSSKGLIGVLYYNKCVNDYHIFRSIGGDFMVVLDPGNVIPNYAVNVISIKNPVILKGVRKELNDYTSSPAELDGVVFYYNGVLVDRFLDYAKTFDAEDVERVRKAGEKMRAKFIAKGYLKAE